ncbi:hypothetical protein ACH41E_02410 [Streptomyces sp. NPDC020412]|uniref:hypothetical protein n=1 Tax=Streptomyces sp. NPDC020412 TaxID=3365073 RepID=UPI00379FE2EA
MRSYAPRRAPTNWTPGAPRWPANWLNINMPFGGAGGRGTGWGRIGGKWTLLDMTDTRTGVISL